MSRKPPKEVPVNPIEMLEADHRRVEALFERLKKTKSPQARLETFLEIKDALTKHAVLEECIFYPAVRTLPDPEAMSLVSEAYGEHEDVKALLAELEKTDPASESFEYTAEVLADAVSHHVEEEETELFPGAGRLLGAERLRALGERMAGASSPPRPKRKQPG